MNGIIIVDKPKDFTSFDVVAKLRGILGTRRIGHGGTLDPMATGVLPVFVGAATAAADILPDTKKAYVARVATGIKTDTGDITGKVIKEAAADIEFDKITAAAKSFVGEYDQIPPMYSAVKLNGTKLYELARKGIEVEREPRKVGIFSLELRDFDENSGEFTLEAECSKGTYIRTLAEDILERAGYIGTLCALRRTRSCGYTEENSHTLSQIELAAKSGGLDGILFPTETAFSAYGEVVLDDNLARLYLNGYRFESARTNAPKTGETVRVKDERGRFLGLGKNADGRFVKVKQFLTEQE